MKATGTILHEKVDGFFGEVNRMLDGMEEANLAALEAENSGAQVESRAGSPEAENAVANV